MCLRKFAGTGFSWQGMTFSHANICFYTPALAVCRDCMLGVIPQVLYRLSKTWAPYVKELVGVGQQCVRDCSHSLLMNDITVFTYLERSAKLWSFLL